MSAGVSVSNPRVDPGSRSGNRLPTRTFRDALAVLTIALGLRLAFALITADTYDPDEFIFLGLGRDLAHGAVAYRDFRFFFPPGMPVVLRALDPVIALWWPLARLSVMVVDCGTALLVWRVGLELWDQRTAFFAALLYSVSPVALVAGVRVDQEPIMTFLGMAAITLLLTRSSSRTALLAGACLGAAVWVKYPAIVFLPVCLLVAPKRWIPVCGAFLAATALLFLPFLGQWRAMVDQTIAWQLFHRVSDNPGRKVEKVAVYWFLANPFALAALARLRLKQPTWLVVGFATGGVFLLTAQAYSHYFVPVAAFGALLGAPLASRLIRLPALPVVAGAMVLMAAWAADVDLGGPGGTFVTATRLSAISPTLRLVQRLTLPGERVLADRLEYAYLSGRPYVPYFWNMSSVVGLSSLEHQLSTAAVVIETHLAGHTFPRGFVRYLRDNFQAQNTPAATVWPVRPREEQAHTPTGEHTSLSKANDHALIRRQARSDSIAAERVARAHPRRSSSGRRV